MEILADCEDCGWVAESRNAQGLASQHAQRTGHMVLVTATRSFIYASNARYSMSGQAAKEAFG